MSGPASDPPGNRLGPSPGASGRSRLKGDVPGALLDRYLIERDRQGRAERYFRDHRETEPRFRDRGGTLTADRSYPDTVADMLAIARHRGWARIRVDGDEAFRREVWIQGRALGLEIKGYRPKERDRQAAGEEAPAAARDRLARAAVIVKGLIGDPAVQARLLDRAHDRVFGRSRDDVAPSRVRERER